MRENQYLEDKKNGWSKDSDSNKRKFFNLPNFDLSIFKSITGIDATEDFKRLMDGNNEI